MFNTTFCHLSQQPDKVTGIKHNIDPKNKGFGWILNAARNIYNNGNGSMPPKFYYRGADRIKEIEDFSRGKQTISRYKKQNSPDRINDNSTGTLDFSVFAIIPKYVDIAKSKLLQRQYEPVCNAIDPLSRTEADEWYREQLVKITAKQAMMQSGLDPNAISALAQNDDDPQTLEDLQLVKQFGYKHKIALDAELVVAESFDYNNYEKVRTRWVSDLINHGIAFVKPYLNGNGQTMFRNVDLSRVFISYCEESDFADATHFGELIYVNASELVRYFTPNQIKEICKSVANKYENPGVEYLNQEAFYDKFNIPVFDICFKSFNSKIFKDGFDELGNKTFEQVGYENIDKIALNNIEGNEKYTNINAETVYQTKWIVGTNYMYDWGEQKNKLVKQSSITKCKLPFVGEAWNFYKMQYAGLTEKLIPLADEYQETQEKIQNLKRRMVPYIINIDLDGLEGVNFGKGGKKLTPPELIDLILTSNINLFRGKNLVDKSGNATKSVSVDLTGMAEELIALGNELKRLEDNIRSIAGLNEVTDGSAPPARMLTTGLNLANQATNNALYLISEADKRIMLQLADAIVLLSQMAISMGKTEGYVRKFGEDTVTSFKLSEDYPLREMGISWIESPDPQQRQVLLAVIDKHIDQGLLTFGDRIFAENCRNLKQAASVIDLRIRKAKEDLQKSELEKINANNEGSAKSAQIAEEEKRKTAEDLHLFKLKEIDTAKEWDYKIKELGVSGTNRDTDVNAHTKIITKQIEQHNKEKEEDKVA